MSASDLAQRTCIPCEGGVPPMKPDEIQEYVPLVPGWSVIENHHLVRTFEFPDFLQALAATNRVGQLAEEQGHHPDLHLGWGSLAVEIWTHKIDGLTESDFILAAKIDEIV
ncbi:MAG: putative pterin-4-alpha-carbinolamine dehydratase [Gemmatimonadota bacterium]|nr:MAG: putative pterin-4-alpha-carbinolamine dehydratase [Gemmatimonadota bacterium]